MQLIQIVHKNAKEGNTEVLSVYEGQLVFSHVEDYDTKSMFFQINIPTGPYQPPALAILSAQRDAIITIHQHSLTLEVMTYMYGCVCPMCTTHTVGALPYWVYHVCLTVACYHNSLTSAQLASLLHCDIRHDIIVCVSLFMCTLYLFILL